MMPQLQKQGGAAGCEEEAWAGQVEGETRCWVHMWQESDACRPAREPKQCL